MVQRRTKLPAETQTPPSVVKYTDAVWDSRDLSHKAKSVCAALARHAYKAMSDVWAADLPGDTGMSADSVSRGKAEAIEKGWLVRTHYGRGGGRSDRFSLVIPHTAAMPKPGNAAHSGNTEESKPAHSGIAEYSNAAHSGRNTAHSGIAMPHTAERGCYPRVLKRDNPLSTVNDLYLKDENQDEDGKEIFWVGKSKRNPNGYFVSQGNGHTQPHGSREVRLDSSQRQRLFQTGLSYSDQQDLMLQWAGFDPEPEASPGENPAFREKSEDFMDQIRRMRDQDRRMKNPGMQGQPGQS